MGVGGGTVLPVVCLFDGYLMLNGGKAVIGRYTENRPVFIRYEKRTINKPAGAGLFVFWIGRLPIRNGRLPFGVPVIG